jgi:SHAQKYF class myb-like DNA-binding protein
MEPETYQFEDAPTPPSPLAADAPMREHSPPQHTKFLDLTNGAGDDSHSYYDDDDEDNEDNDDSDNDNDNESSGDDEMLMIHATNTPASPHKKPNSSGESPKVVPVGHEATGRWTKEEHSAFLQGLKMYGKEWKKVAAKVRTRTVVQTRTHAQKYFQKLQKAVESGEVGVDDVPMGTGSRSTSVKKKRKSSAAATSPPLLPPPQVASAAHLLSNFSSTDESPFADVPRIESAGSFSKPEPKARLYSSPHGFITHTVASSEYNYTASKLPNNFSMSIIAPEHDVASRRGKFPEPSPAACGKRKLAEIAAARMLAGVFGNAADEDGSVTPPPEVEGASNTSIQDLPEPPIIPSSKKPAGFGLSLQIVNPETLGVSYETEQKRRKEGGSPQTPWEGQLAALVR